MEGKKRDRGVVGGVVGGAVLSIFYVLIYIHLSLVFTQALKYRKETYMVRFLDKYLYIFNFSFYKGLQCLFATSP